jgi:putative ATPase
VRQDVEQTRNDPVPLHLRNAVTGLMKGLGYGRGYEYAHDTEAGVSAQGHLPDNLAGRRWYVPTNRGFEATLAERQRRIEEIVEEARGRQG